MMINRRDRRRIIWLQTKLGKKRVIISRSSEMRTLTLPVVLNPIFQKGTPTLAAGLKNATQTCNLSGIPLEFDASRVN